MVILVKILMMEYSSYDHVNINGHDEVDDDYHENVYNVVTLTFIL